MIILPVTPLGGEYLILITANNGSSVPPNLYATLSG